jgi:hypothetical protein
MRLGSHRAADFRRQLGEPRIVFRQTLVGRAAIALGILRGLLRRLRAGLVGDLLARLHAHAAGTGRRAAARMSARRVIRAGLVALFLTRLVALSIFMTLALPWFVALALFVALPLFVALARFMSLAWFLTLTLAFAQSLGGFGLGLSAGNLLGGRFGRAGNEARA